MPRVSRETLIFSLIIGGGILADQLTKLLIFEGLPEEGTISVIGGLLRLKRGYNPGFAWGVFSKVDKATINAFAAAVSLVIIAAVIWLYVSAGSARLRVGVPLGLIMGGALGNLIDRIFVRSVRDFIELYATIGGRERAWPVFNVADAFICIGVGLFLLPYFHREEKIDGEDADS